jgi:hypothetical protein
LGKGDVARMAEIRKQGSGREEVLVRIVNQMVFVRNESPIPDPDGDGRTYLTNYDYVENTLVVTLNGLRQREGEDFDYIEEGGNKFRFNFPLLPEDSVICDYIKII